MKAVRINKFTTKFVGENDQKLFNVNNLYETQPADYWSRTITTDQWIDAFHDNYFTLTFDADDLEWMKRAKKVSQYKMNFRFSPIFNEELEQTCKKYDQQMKTIMSSRDRWFVKSERYSFKTTPYRGPYSDLETIIKGLVHYYDGHDNIYESDTSKTVYFLPWQTMEQNKEFRIFVYQNKITAISQQYIYRANDWLANKSTEELEAIVCLIVDFFNVNIAPKMTSLTNYVMDLALIDCDGELTPYFIEANVFGREYGSGSSLFHWIKDEDRLTDSETVDLHFIDKEF